MDKNYEEGMNNDTEVFKLVNFGSQKNIENVEKESYEINKMAIIDDLEYDERYHIGESVA